MAMPLRSEGLVCRLLWRSLKYCCACGCVWREAHLHPDTKKRIIEVNGIFYVTTVKTLLSQVTASFKSLLKNAERVVLQK